MKQQKVELESHRGAALAVWGALAVSRRRRLHYDVCHIGAVPALLDQLDSTQNTPHLLL